MPKRRRTGFAAAGSGKRQRLDADAGPSTTVEVVNPEGGYAHPSLVDIFSVAPMAPPEIEWIKLIDYYPENTLDENNPSVDFNLLGSQLEFLDMGRGEMELTGAVELATAGDDGSKKIGANEHKKFAVTPMGMYGLWKDVETSYNSIIVETSNGLLMWQNHAEMMTTMPQQKIETEMAMAGVYFDSPGKMDSMTITAGENDGLADVQTQWALSAPVTWRGKIALHGILSSKKLLPLNVGVRIKYTRNKQEHLLRTAEGDKNKYKFVIKSIKLKIPKLRLSNESALAIETQLQRQNAHYKVKKYLSTFITVPANIQSQTITNLYSGASPLCTLITMLDSNDRFQGTMAKNSYMYSDNGVRKIRMNLDDESEMRDPIRVDDKNVTDAVQRLWESFGYYHHPYKSCIINADNFNDGKQIYTFNGCNFYEIREDFYSILKRGNMIFQVDFKDKLDAPIVVLVHMIFLTDVQITADRRILHEYN